ncbi:hypothetical protein GLUCOINTEAF2_0204067 [Komagataeibacter intermedius AF2]|uniref:Uncharacterized protein n=1 Tax=Komagataeibacter intermedius AF2 TaxID=1458464 RepID=A0A0N1FD41_9PROT|nr:hypothetical protein GLUCOINTEAF2_0204067 [Komagataeibacter intermedius AF2]
MQVALLQRLKIHIAADRPHFGERIGDRGAGRHDQRTFRIFCRQVARLHEEIPGPLRAVRIDPLEVGLVGCKTQLPELLRFIDEDLVDADLSQMHKIVLSSGKAFQLRLHLLLHALDPLAREAIGRVDALQHFLVRRNLRLDHLALEIALYRDEPECVMRDDDRIPVSGRSPGKEPLALCLHEVRLVSDKDPRGRVEHEEFAGHLGEAVTGNGDHRLADQAKPLLLHDGRNHREGLSRTDRVRDIRAARGDDPPDHPFLVGAQADCGACTGQAQMGAIERTCHEVVVGVVIQPDQPLGPIAILPDPCLERTPDRRQFFLCGFRLLCVQFAVLIAIAITPDIPYFW